MSAICDAHKKKVGIKLLSNSGHRKFSQLEIRGGRENQHPERLGPQAPGWAAQENRKETLLWPEEWGSICCSSVPSPIPSHSKTLSNPFEPFQIKWEVYFSKELCRSSLLCRRYASACICVCIAGHGYSTPTVAAKSHNFQERKFSETPNNRKLLRIFFSFIWYPNLWLVLC